MFHEKSTDKNLQPFFLEGFFLKPFSCLDFLPFFPVEVKWPCGNDEIAKFPLQVINSNRKDCSAGRALLGY